MENRRLPLLSLLNDSDELPGLILGEKSWSRAQLRDASHATARHFKRLGLGAGDTLAVWLPNVPAWFQLLFAASETGVLIVPVSTRLKAPEVAHIVEVSQAKGLVYPAQFLDQDFAAVAQELHHDNPALELMLPLVELDNWLPTGDLSDSPGEAPAGEQHLQELLCCFSTSGTTGSPKLAAHDHAGIVRHAQQVASAFDFRPGDKLLASLPLYGVFGFVAGLAALAGGAACDLMPVFKADEAANRIDQCGITHVIGSDSMFMPIFNVGGHAFKSWRRIAQADFVGQSLTVIGKAAKYGIEVSGTYGSSEVFALMSLWPADASAESRARGGGIPVDPAITFRVCDPETGVSIAKGAAGELQIRGPNVLSGYLNNPVASKAAMTPDGWFRTGDMAVHEGEGFVYLSRLGDSLRLRGYLVNPAEIESVLMTHEAVSGAQVVGVTRAGLPDLAVAFVTQINPDEALEESDLLAYCKQEMAGFKLPERILIVGDFPSVDGPNGNKIQKRVLRETAARLFEPGAA